MDESFLLLFDADRIREYVFATGRLKDIRGASALVRDLTDLPAICAATGLAQWFPGNAEGVIYAAGAAGALLVRGQARALAICEQLERNYRQATAGALLSAVSVRVADSSPAALAHARRRALRLLARRKAGRPHVEQSDSGGALRFCDRDRLHPATRSLPDPDRATDLLVSTQTAAKWRHSFVDRQAVESSDWWQAFLTLLRERGAARWHSALDEIHQRGHETMTPPDLGSIGSQSRPSGYIAFVHIDGDGIGRAIDQVAELAGFTGYAALSNALWQAANNATGWALATAYQDREPRPYIDLETGRPALALPFEVITVGGDDVILVCSADRGLQVACELSRRFSEVLNEQCVQHGLLAAGGLTQVPTASAGIVIAHDSMPIVQLQRRARELLRSAKRGRQPGVGGIDFHVVTTPSLDTIERVRATEYAVFDEAPTGTQQQSRPLTSRTRRPYTLLEAEALLAHARQLAPVLLGSKRADLYLACQGERTQVTLDVLAIHTRLGNEARSVLTSALNHLSSISSYPFGAPDDRGVYATALPDLLEAIEFIADEENP